MTSLSTELDPITPPTSTTAKQYINTTLKSFFSEDIRKTYYAISVLSGLMIFFIYFSHINYTPKISITDSGHADLFRVGDRGGVFADISGTVYSPRR